MAWLDIPHFTDPEFAPIRGRLARAYIEHKADLGPQAAAASDQAILDHADDITALLLGGAARALAAGNAAWLVRYSWFTELVEALTDKRPGKPLDG